MLTHIINLLQWRLLTCGFTPVTSFKSCLLVCSSCAWLDWEPSCSCCSSPPEAGAHSPRMELLLKPLSDLLSANYSYIPSPNVPQDQYFSFWVENPDSGARQLLPGLPEGSALLWKVLWGHGSSPWGGYIGHSMWLAALLQKCLEVL